MGRAAWRDIVVDGDDVYFAEFQSGIRRVATAGGGLMSIVEDSGMSRTLSVDCTSVYFILEDGATAGVFSVPRDGSASPRLLASTEGRYEVATDGSGLYFDDESSVARIAR